jgi:deferrochelatase/peroxidase EfeB
MDPYGCGCPFGAHIRRMNPRDTAVNMNRRKMIRRGGTYGAALLEGVPDARLKGLPSKRKQRENDRGHVAEKLQRWLPKFNQFSQNEVFGRDRGI